MTKKSIKLKRLKLESKINKIKTEIKKLPVFCNKCGNSCQIKDKHTKDNYGLINAKIHGGYNSPKLEDCTSYTFSLCEFCLSELFQTFKIKIDKEEN